MLPCQNLFTGEKEGAIKGWLDFDEPQKKHRPLDVKKNGLLVIFE